MYFKEKYLSLKKEGYTDVEAADLLNMKYYRLQTLKKRLGLRYHKRCRKNKSGLTEKEIRKGEENGLTRRNILKRISKYGFTSKEACTIPINQKRKGVIK